jgi:tetratricopeptide (TPR) repeat protein
MFLSAELMSFPLDMSMLAYGAGLAAAGTLLGSAFTPEHVACQDIDGVQKRIDELEKGTSRSLEESDELAGLYLTLAEHLEDHGADVQELIDLYAKAEDVLKNALAQGEDTELRRKLGTVYLQRGVLYNDCDEFEDAVESYELGAATFKPLDEAGDGEAKYDLAGVKLNLGVVYGELGEYEKSKAALDESFLLYRAVEKIGFTDTRHCMAQVSVQQGNILHLMGEELDKITDAYNRAMRLLVELIEDAGQLELERELANVLLDRCLATYENLLEKDFDSEIEKINKVGDVLIDIGRAIDLLEKQHSNGNEEARGDLFQALMSQVHVLVDIEKYTEAKKILDRGISDFHEFGDSENPFLASEFASAYDQRANCAALTDDKEQALSDFNEAVRIREAILQNEELDEDDKGVFIPQLAATYAASATYKASVGGDKDTARNELQHAIGLMDSLSPADDAEDRLEEIKSNLKMLLDSIK